LRTAETDSDADSPTLVTDNEREFARVGELPRENWLGEPS
jgi:hypothetical protein